MSYEHVLEPAARFQHQYTEVKFSKNNSPPPPHTHTHTPLSVYLAVTGERRNPSAFSEFYIHVFLKKRMAMAM